MDWTSGIYLVLVVILAVYTSRRSRERSVIKDQDIQLRESVNWIETLTRENGVLKERNDELTSRINPDEEAPEIQAKVAELLKLHRHLFVLMRSMSTPDDAGYRAWWREFVRSALLGFCELYAGGLVYRGAVLIPSGPEFLKISIGSRVSDESIVRRKFYYGNDVNRFSERGIAGTVYANRECIHVPSIEQSQFHLPLDERCGGDYQSMIAVLIGSVAEPLGVLSVESYRNVFQPSFDMMMLQSVADVLASGLLLLRDAGVSLELLVEQ